MSPLGLTARVVSLAASKDGRRYLTAAPYQAGTGWLGLRGRPSAGGLSASARQCGGGGRPVTRDRLPLELDGIVRLDAGEHASERARRTAGAERRRAQLTEGSVQSVEGAAAFGGQLVAAICEQA